MKHLYLLMVGLAMTGTTWTQTLRHLARGLGPGSRATLVCVLDQQLRVPLFVLRLHDDLARKPGDLLDLLLQRHTRGAIPTLSFIAPTITFCNDLGPEFLAQCPR